MFASSLRRFASFLSYWAELLIVCRISPARLIHPHHREQSRGTVLGGIGWGSWMAGFVGLPGWAGWLGWLGEVGWGLGRQAGRQGTLAERSTCAGRTWPKDPRLAADPRAQGGHGRKIRGRPKIRVHKEDLAERSAAGRKIRMHRQVLA